MECNITFSAHRVRYLRGGSCAVYAIVLLSALLTCTLPSLMLGGCARERDEISDAFARDRVVTLRRSIESAVKATTVAAQELADVSGQMRLHLENPDRESAFVAGRRAFALARSRADAATTRLANVRRNAETLLEEWSRETRDYVDSNRREQSRQELADMKQRWEPLKQQTAVMEKTYNPLLVILSDDVLALKQRRAALGNRLDGGPTETRDAAMLNVTTATDDLHARCADFIAALPANSDPVTLP